MVGFSRYGIMVCDFVSKPLLLDSKDSAFMCSRPDVTLVSVRVLSDILAHTILAVDMRQQCGYKIVSLDKCAYFN